jgi:hypothetical protein
MEADEMGVVYHRSLWDFGNTYGNHRRNRDGEI